MVQIHCNFSFFKFFFSFRSIRFIRIISSLLLHNCLLKWRIHRPILIIFLQNHHSTALFPPKGNFNSLLLPSLRFFPHFINLWDPDTQCEKPIKSDTSCTHNRRQTHIGNGKSTNDFIIVCRLHAIFMFDVWWCILCSVLTEMANAFWFYNAYCMFRRHVVAINFFPKRQTKTIESKH